MTASPSERPECTSASTPLLCEISTLRKLALPRWSRISRVSTALVINAAIPRKTRGKRDRKSPQHAYAIVDLFSREVVLVIIGNQPAIWTENAVDFGHDNVVVGSGSHLRHHVIERAIKSECLGKCALVHPKHAEATTVRNGLSRVE